MSLPPPPPTRLPQIGLPGYAALPSALAGLSRGERASYCNAHWQAEQRRVFSLEFRWAGGGGAEPGGAASPPCASMGLGA